MDSSGLLFAGCAALSLAASALAQVDASAVDPALVAHRVPIHTAAPDEGVDYGIWAAGGTYKCSFHDGMTFVPYLGADYPRNQPWRWTTESVRVGAVELLQERAEETWHDGYRFEYRHGAVTEAYDVGLEGVEQTFVFSQPLRGGDLVIDGEIESALVAPPRAAAHQGLTFRDSDGRPILTYSAAFVLDAAGRRAAIATAYEAGRVRLRVPAAWLANATFPVIVDPVLSPKSVAGISNGYLRKIDVARDDVGNDMMVTYVQAASQFDDDVRAVLTSDTFTGVFPVYADVTTSWDSDDAGCCFVGGATKFAIAWRRYFYTSTPRSSRIRGHVHPSGSTSLSTSYASMSVFQSANYWRPVIGGVEAFAAGSHALVVCQAEDNSASSGNMSGTDDSYIISCQFDASSTNGSFGTRRPVTGHPDQDCERPTVNKVAEGGAGFSWVTVWQVYNTATNDGWKLTGSRVPYNGVPIPNRWYPDDFSQSTEHLLHPVLEGQGGRYAVAFVSCPITSAPGKTSLVVGDRVHVERFDWLHSSSLPSTAGDRPPVEIASGSAFQFQARGIGYDTGDQSHWALAYSDTPSTHRALRYARVGYGGAVTEAGSLAAAGPTGLYPYGGACVFDDDHREFKFAWGAGLSVQGQRVTYLSSGGHNATGFTCSSAVIDWIGNQQIGAETNYVAVSGAPSGSGHFLLVSLASADQVIVYPGVAAGCRLLVDNGPAFLGTLPLRFGSNATWGFPLPEWLDPTTFHFQDWIFDGSQFVSTRRLEVPVVK